MAIFLDTRGRQTLGIGICDRCKRKFPLDHLSSDRNTPGLKVCRDDNDEYDPWRLPARAPDDITLRFVRPDVDLTFMTEATNGWSPVLGAYADGATRVVLQIITWVGGTGDLPAVGYVGASGIVANPADAVDVAAVMAEAGAATIAAIGSMASGWRLYGPQGFTPDNQLHIMAGDSTTWQAQANGGMGYAFNDMNVPGGILDNSLGFCNMASSGWTLEGFVTGGATPGFVGPQVGDPYWNYDFKKNGGSPDRAAIAVTLDDCITFIGTLDPLQPVIFTICLGINDVLLYPATGNLPQDEIQAYIAGYLRTAVEALRQAKPGMPIILRVPNPMIARPATLPSDANYPTFSTDLSYAAALIDKWNNALRDAYIEVSEEYDYVVLWDVYTTTMGFPDPLVDTVSNYPAYTDNIHPSISSYYSLGIDYANLLRAPQGTVPYGRMVLAEALAETNATVLEDQYALYCQGHPELYQLVATCDLVGVGSNYMDLGMGLGDFSAAVAGRSPIYIQIGTLAAQRFTSFTALASASNTRLVSITPNSLMQTATAQLPVKVYVDISEGTGDAYLDPLIFDYSTYRVSYRAVIAGAGVGYMDVAFVASQGMFKIKSLRDLTGLYLALGDGVDVNLDLSTWSVLSWTPSALQMRIGKTGDWSAYNQANAALLVTQSAIDPKEREAPYVLGAVGRLSSLYAMAECTNYQVECTTISVTTGIAVATDVTVEAFVFASNLRTSLGSVTITANSYNGTITHASRTWAPGEALELVVTSPGSYVGNAIVAGRCG